MAKNPRKRNLGVSGVDARRRSSPRLVLRHREVIAVLAGLGFQGPATRVTFYEYVKSLRKLGTPFPGGKIGHGRRVLARYSYEHLMELALVLSLRVYHVVPEPILAEIIRHRKKLVRLYRRAYLERATKLGRITTFTSDGQTLRVSGTFLDLQIDFSGGTFMRFGPPRLIGPAEAIRIFVARDLAARSLLPIHLSALAERLIAAAAKASSPRRNPPARKSPAHSPRKATRP
jgi:hypothetical protein